MCKSKSKSKEYNFTDFILTRYLYVFDEVGLSFVESLLTHKSIDETIFWLSELYHSGFCQKSWELLWFVYFDFYFVSYPGFIKYLTQKHKTFTFQSLLGVAHNLHAFKRITPFVFLFRLLSCNHHTIKDPILPSVYKGRKPAWLLENFPDESIHHFIRDLFTHRYESIACHSLPDIASWEKDSDNVAMRFLSGLQTFYQVDPAAMDSFISVLLFCFSDETVTDKEDKSYMADDDIDIDVENNKDEVVIVDQDTKITSTMDKGNDKGENEEEVNVEDLNEHDVDIVQEMTYRPYKNQRHVLLAIVCLFEFSLSSSSKSPGIIPDPNIFKNDKVEGGGGGGAEIKDFNYSQYLDKEYKITTASWSPKYIRKRYNCHTYMKWTAETFIRKTIFLGTPKSTVDKFELNEPFDASSGKLPSYSTSENIIPFVLSRESYDYDIEDLWKDKWLYFASKCPLWYTRLSNCKFDISHEDNTLNIISDDDIDAFHSAYPYDPEQASDESLENAIPRLYQEYLLIDWLNIVFPDSVLVEHCYGNARLAVYLKYRTNSLLHLEHVWY